jgi:hypothetical protein
MNDEIRTMKRFTLSILAATAVAACGSEPVEPPALVLFDSTPAATADCPNGGQTIRTGLDDNDDRVLQDEEVDSVENLCNGPDGEIGDPGDDGLRTLVDRSEEPAGNNCPNGGERIRVGVDDDADGTLDDEEIDATTYVCRGEDGDDAPALLTATSTNAGGLCEEGGTVFTAGVDTNRNGVLDEAEITETRASCNGASGAATIVVVENEPAGAECPVGGSRIVTGTDENGDGQLADSEIFDEAFVCDPTVNLVEVTDVAVGTSTACPNGGQQIDQGIDTNGDGTLEAAEIQSTRLVCNGLDGLPVLAGETNEPAGTNCPDGGTRLAVGRDLDLDGTLDPDEEESVSFVCDGAPGEDGTTGTAVRTSSEPPGPNCINGGTRIETGTDANADGVLADSEVSQTSFACDGQAAQTLVDISPEPPGTNCADGGRIVTSGPDTNSNGTLDPAEVSNTTFLCNTLASVSVGITTQSLPGGLEGNAYGATITATGGNGGSYSWSITSGALPSGLTLDPTGTPSTQISGTPGATGTFNFTVQVEDFFGNTGTQAFTLVVTEIFRVTSFTLPRLEQGTAYSASLSSAGNTGVVSWAVVDGSLPNGISLGSNGTFSGTPTDGAGSRFIVEATDGGSGDAILVALRIKGEQDYVYTCGDTITDGQDDMVIYPLTGGTTGAGVTVTGANADADCADQVEFSPSGGDFIAFTGEETSGIEELFVASTTATVAATKVNLPLMTTSNDVDEFAWSSDGRYLAYNADDVSNFDENLFVVDTMSFPNVTTTQVNAVNGDVFSFAWVPGTSQLVYVYEDQTTGDEEIRIADAANLGTETTLNGPLVAGGNVSSTFAISPDGDWVVYRADELVDNEFRLFSVDISGATPGAPTEVSGLTDPDADADFSDFGFSPNGRWLAFIGDANNEEDALFAVDFDGGFARSRLSPVLNDSALDVFEFAWSPNSRRVALRGDLDVDLDTELYVADTEIPGSTIQLNPEPQTGLQDVDTFSDEFAWSPNGDYVVFNFDEDTSVNEPFLVFLGDAANPVRLAGMAGLSDDGGQAYKVSDDGDLVFATLELNSSTQVELFVATVDAGTQTVGALTNANSFMDASSDTNEDYALIDGGDSVLYRADPFTAFEDNALIRSVAGGTIGTETQVNPTLPAGGDVDDIGVEEE